jgi:hypothetical protein
VAPDEGWLEVRLPAPLARLANRPHGRYDITLDPVRDRWYLDASWKTAPGPAPSPGELRQHPVLAVDLNHGHLAAWVITPDGNPAGPPVTVPLDLAGLPATRRDGRLRAAISTLIRIARTRGCAAIAVEDLDFAQARAEGRERHGNRPSRGTPGPGVPPDRDGHPHRQVPGPARPDDTQPGPRGDRGRPGLHVPLGG